MKHRILLTIVGLFALFIVSPPLVHTGFQDFIKDAKEALGRKEDLTEDEIINGLKEALEVGTSNAVEVVSKTDGYYKNPKIKIPLPESAQKTEKILRTFGFGQQVDDFELSMNRAAEQAAPEAKSIFWDAIKQMSFEDSRTILNGRDNEATLYFKDKTSARLTEIFKPIAHQAMSEVGVTQSYQALDKKVQTMPFADSIAFDLDQYVTDKSINGLFLMLAEEEKKIRQNPAAQVTDLLKKVFGKQ